MIYIEKELGDLLRVDGAQTAAERLALRVRLSLSCAHDRPSEADFPTQRLQARIRLGKRIESDAESESNRTESRARSVRTTTRTGGNAETRRVRRSHAVVERVVERVVVV